MEFAGPPGTAPSSSAVTSPVEAVHELYESHYQRLVRLATMLLGDVGPGRGDCAGRVCRPDGGLGAHS